MPARNAGPSESPAAQLLAMLAKFDPKGQKLFRAVRSALRKRLPAANELAYEYADSVVIGFTPTEHAIEGIVALALRADGVALYFHEARRLPDPKKLLQGSGKQARFIAVEAVSRLKHPDVEALFMAAVRLAKKPAQDKGRLIIRTSAATKRPRRK